MSDFNLDDDIFGTDDNLDFAQGDAFFEDDDLTAVPPTDDSAFDDPFDQLRDKTVRGETVDNNLAADEDNIAVGENTSSGGGFSLDQFSPGQRLVLAILVILNIIVIGFGLLVVLKII
ncbi:MAG TPA: hypothetical protein EYP41_07360 [Anaerolineae bacterium]|nr:hypothetical protein [Anaerolineae bacterium]HIP70724.1 hypothetical protein [Anaerolineae bacterium]